jgi:hypothetical protein
MARPPLTRLLRHCTPTTQTRLQREMCVAMLSAVMVMQRITALITARTLVASSTTAMQARTVTNSLLEAAECVGGVRMLRISSQLWWEIPQGVWQLCLIEARIRLR